MTAMPRPPRFGPDLAPLQGSESGALARFLVRCEAMPPKTSCPVSLTQFREKAEPMKVIINGQEMLAEVKEFSTGSFGWYMNGKTVVTIDGKAVSVQIGMNLTVVGSKDAER
jgi:hypothetical protein